MANDIFGGMFVAEVVEPAVDVLAELASGSHVSVWQRD